jgi:fatty acid desaturase
MQSARLKPRRGIARRSIIASMTVATLDLDSKEFRPQMGKKESLPTELFQRSDAKGLLRLAVHLSLLLCTGFALDSSLGTVLSLGAIFLHGVVLAFLFSALHECIHSTAFKSRLLNDAVASLCGFVLLLPREYFRAFHLQHHRYTQDPVRDPELSAKKPGTIREYLLILSGLPYWSERVTTLIRHARGDVTERFVPGRKRLIIVREARFHLALYSIAAIVSLAAQSGILLIYWVLPVMAGQPMLRAFLLAEHTGCPHVSNMLMNTRTTLSNPVVRLLSWNMPYHAEHHAWAAVPFHKLPVAHRHAGEQVAHLSRGYVEFHRSLWRGLKKPG